MMIHKEMKTPINDNIKKSELLEMLSFLDLQWFLPTFLCTFLYYHFWMLSF